LTRFQGIDELVKTDELPRATGSRFLFEKTVVCEKQGFDFMADIVVEEVKKTYVVRSGFRRTTYVEALKGVSLRVTKGSIHALLGPNGAGKTTLVKIISTLVKPDSGRVLVGGFDAVEEADKVRALIGLVLDVSKGMYGSLTGFQNLVFYGLLKGYSYSDARRRAREVLELVGLDEESAFKKPYYSYSLGMRARVGLAKALFTDPDVLLLDEPTLGLDVSSSMVIRGMLVDFARRGRTILVTGHNMREIEEISSEVTIINRGLVIAQGGINELKRKLGLANVLSIKLEGAGSREFVSRLKGSLQIIKVEANENSVASSYRVYARNSREEIVDAVTKLIKGTSARVVDFSIAEPSLEDAYLAVVGDTLRR